MKTPKLPVFQMLKRKRRARRGELFWWDFYTPHEWLLWTSDSETKRAYWVAVPVKEKRK